MLRDIIGQRRELAGNGKPARSKSAVAAFESVDAPLLNSLPLPDLAASLESPVSPDFPDNHLANEFSLKGVIHCASDLFLDGEVEGEVSVDGHLSVGSSARITGEVRATSIMVRGQVTGNITVAERCVLEATAMVTGDISARSISIADGATFFGQSAVGAQQPSGPPADPEA